MEMPAISSRSLQARADDRLMVMVQERCWLKTHHPAACHVMGMIVVLKDMTK